MCGISGIISKKIITKVDFVNQKKLCKLLKHRGPDATKVIKTKNYITGCTRLAIVDIKKRSNLPMENKRYIISFNGEIYNFRELRNKLINYGTKFNTKSDTEVLLKLYEKFGIKCFRKLEGMYAVVIYDKKNKNSIFARDPLGIKPLYYNINSNKIFYSSELRVLGSFQKQTLNYKKIKEYILTDNIIGKETLFKNFYKIEKGQVIVFNKNIEIIKRLNNKIFSYKKNKKFKTLNIKSFFNNRVIKHIPADNIKAGIFLSSGIDSSLIAKIISHELFKKKIKLKAFSAFIKFPKINEEKSINSILQKIPNMKIISKKIEKNSYLNDFIYLSKNLDFPVFNPHLLALHQLSKKMKNKNIKVAFTGDGADELFNGYNWGKANYKDEKEILLFGLNKNLNSYDYLFKKNIKIESDFDKSVKKFKKHTKKLKKKDKIRFFNQNNYLEKYLYTRDAIGMLNSVEIRVPYCDTSLYRIVNKKFDASFQNKIILKKIAKENNFQDFKKKIGFTIPLRSWFTKNVIKKLISKTNLHKSKYINFENFISCINNKNFLEKNIRLIWSIIAFEIWVKNRFVN
tara:strand:+ start:3612 stop:5324 length:1713 start_codon:yes stop_codon:yes gene_type:complete